MSATFPLSATVSVKIYVSTLQRLEDEKIRQKRSLGRRRSHADLINDAVNDMLRPRHSTTEQP